MPSFLDLSPRVRQEIYRYALVVERIFVRPLMSSRYFIESDRQQRYGVPNLALLRVAKPVYREAMPVYLGENTFSIVQVDMLAALAHENPRIYFNLKQVRRIELIFDARDYIFRVQHLAVTVSAVSAAVDELAPDSDAKEKTLARLNMTDERLDLGDVKDLLAFSKNPTFFKPAQRKEMHTRHNKMLQEYLWGRTLTFTRQMFNLTLLVVNLSNCTCVGGCCRLAGEVLGWGSVHVWVHGVPAQVHVHGANNREKRAIAQILDKQSLDLDMKPEEIYDQSKAVSRSDFLEYIRLLRNVHKKVLHRSAEWGNGNDDGESPGAVGF